MDCPEASGHPTAQSTFGSIAVGRPNEDPAEAFAAEATLDDGTPAALRLLVLVRMMGLLGATATRRNK
jgi:hypothetical protein